jgi:DNA-binding transcriptional regulator LsrR (DeoR family)
MAFREVSVVQIKEVLRLWLKGAGERTVAESVGIDRKTVRRYVEAARELGLERSGGEQPITDELILRANGVPNPLNASP